MSLPQRIRIAEQLVRRVEWQDLDPAALRRFVEAARAEAGACPSLRPGGHSRFRTAELVAESDLPVCGVGMIPIISSAFGINAGSRPWVSDGATVAAGGVIATLSGPGADVRSAVAIASAVVRRLSGITMFTRKHTIPLGEGRARLLDSGEFTPGWLKLEKYALAHGGAWDGGNHLSRIRVQSAGRDRSELESKISAARGANAGIPVEIEVRDPASIEIAAATTADLLRLLDFEIAAIRKAVARVNGRKFIEAHGGIDCSNIGRYAGLGLDFVSVDGLVSHATWASVGVVWRD